MEFMEMVRSRRSIRSFKSDPVPANIDEQLLEGRPRLPLDQRVHENGF